MSTTPIALEKILCSNVPYAPQQDISYTAFNKTWTITEGNYHLEYFYGLDQQRRMSILKYQNAPKCTTIFEGNYEKIIYNGGNTYEVHYIAGGSGLTAINVRHNGSDQLFYVYIDHLGSILKLTNGTGNIVYETNYDAWGRERNPNDWTYITCTTETCTIPEWLIRGFTGHEHLQEFALINMNGRMYDPHIGRMLGPDNFVQNPFYSQSYNRYTYALNNPLAYTDPSGEDALDIIFMPFRVINEGANWLSERSSGNSTYSYDWNYVKTGQLPHDWRNDPNVVLGPNGYPIGPGGEYNAFGGYGGYNIDNPDAPHDYLSAQYANRQDYFNKVYGEGAYIYEPIYKSGQSYAGFGNVLVPTGPYKYVKGYKARYVSAERMREEGGGTPIELTSAALAPFATVAVAEPTFVGEILLGAAAAGMIAYYSLQNPFPKPWYTDRPRNYIPSQPNFPSGIGGGGDDWVKWLIRGGGIAGGTAYLNYRYDQTERLKLYPANTAPRDNTYVQPPIIKPYNGY